MKQPFLDVQLLKVWRNCAKKIATQFGLRNFRICLFHPNDPDRRTCRGTCFLDGLILLNTRKCRGVKFDSMESNIDTLIHELAHLRYRSHNQDFWKFHQRMKKWFYKNLY